MHQTYRWGMLAPGKIAHKFASGLQYVPGAELYAIASRDEVKAKNFADQYHAPVSYGSYEALATDPLVDIIYIATPHTFHMENTLLCLEHGKAVLCEKPLAINSYQVETMIQSAKENDSFLMEAVWSRFLPNIHRAKELVESGKIGVINHLEADFGFKADYDPHSRLFDPALGGGALLDIGIYPLFFALYLFGVPNKVESEAKLAPTGVDESCRVKLTFAGGETANIYITVTEFTAVEARIEGDQGTIHLPNRWYQPGNLAITTEHGTEDIVMDFVGNGYNYQAVEVMNCLKEGRRESTRWSHNDSLQLMRLMDEIREQCGIEYPADHIDR